MKHSIQSWMMVCVAGVCWMALPTSGRSQGFYVNGAGGVALADNVDLKRYFGSTDANLGMDTGVRFSVSGGWNLNEYVGFEGETGYIYNSFRHVDGALWHVPLLANVVFRYDRPNFKLIPYAGAGLGGDISIISLDHVAGNGVVADGSESTWEFAWQAFAGVRYRINAQMSAGIGYKYYSVDPASWDFAGFNDSIKIGRANVHSIQVEFSMKF